MNGGGSEHSEQPFKIGTHHRGEGIVPFRYGNVFESQDGDPDRLIIAAERDHVGLLLRLAREMPPPFFLMYVLHSSNTSRAEGRYHLVGLNEDEVWDILNEFRPLFEGDARHHVWLGSTMDGSLLVYDQHDLIYAYGPLEQYESILIGQGMREGEIEMPFPHTHHLRHELDEMEQRLLDRYPWKWTPLEPEDVD